jgi:hypothetical protein
LAWAQLVGDEVSITEAQRGSKRDSLISTIRGWLSEGPRTLLALDAPLGWPQAFGSVLMQHRAGEPLGAQANELFRRATDRFIKARLGKQPLDVGADRIARTALAALAMLHEIAQSVGKAIPLAWSPTSRPALSAIEVYPAATRIAHSGRHSARSMSHDDANEHLRVHIHCAERVEALCSANEHVRDAAVCVLAASDFLHGEAVAPDDEELARREGWIWVRDPDLPCNCRR